eukprot:TRINITY_DN18_c0_g1_i1.p1 TRINITY_DN18_c0_g1~~TRINITY_DN18_c0_g1_i1.p1  ORF type:complete len:1364 (+),score=345.60 TRINITY_DN18_c0_g1_i1:82-4173(+)
MLSTMRSVSRVTRALEPSRCAPLAGRSFQFPALQHVAQSRYVGEGLSIRRLNMAAVVNASSASPQRRSAAGVSGATPPKDVARLPHLPEIAPKEEYDLLIPDLFKKAAQAHPDAVALDGPKMQMTYRELDQVTDELAAFLRTNYRAVPETVCGVFMERCEEYVIAVLAILKTGAAYCPIELAYPGPLLQSVFDEVEPRIVLTKETHASRVPLHVSSFNLDGDWVGSLRSLSPDPAVLQENKATGDNLGYVIYSGGSTGKPKGIEAPHRSPVASYLWRYEVSGYQPGCRVGCNVFFVWEIFRPLLRGGTTVVIPDDIIFDAHQLAPYLKSKAITEVLFTPSLFESLLSTVDTSFLRSLPLQVVWFNGEVVTTKLMRQAKELLPHVSFCNTYSISECGEVAAGRIDEEREDCPKFCCVGNLAGFVDHKLMATEGDPEPVAKGEAGELWVSGRGIGRGYTKNPTKTAEVFITHEGVPYYRTGDLARELHDGALEVLGRCDFMVKVRGYSIVLGAVEAAIFKLLGAGQCCVVAKGEEGTDKRLAAYIVPCNSGELRGRLDLANSGIDDFGRSPALFQELLKELPHYAVPSVFVVLDSLPINPVSTKVNRQALPPLPSPPPAAVVSKDFQFDGSEDSARQVFEETLSLPANSLTVDSNFFENGGHSLLASKLLARVKELGGPQVKVADFMKSPTVAGLARLSRGEAAPTEPMRFLPHEVEKYTQNIPDIGLNLQAYWRYTVFTNSSTRVLLTGATGYVGAHLLARLLRTTTGQVFCVVRAENDADAQERITKQLEKHGLHDLDLSRLQAIAGDVSRPNLGLTEDEYIFLRQLVDVVIHAAANVNLAYAYNLLEAANVQGTANAIDFARGGKVKALHYISTDGIFPEVGEAGSFAEADTPPHHLLHTGYGQTKWVAEQMVRKAQQSGLPCTIYRLGNVGGPTTGSGWNPNDSNLLFLRACVERGAVPDDGDWSLEYTPVDFVTDFVVNCMMDPKFASTKTFHLINPSKISMHKLAQVATRVGFPIDRMDKGKWCNSGKGGADDGLLDVVLGQEALDSLLGRHHTYGMANTEAACARFGLSYPESSDGNLGASMRRLISERQLPSPTSMPGRLSGRVAVVTGASSGIGQSVAKALAMEGATVVVAARSVDKLQTLAAQLRGAVPIKCDVTNKREVRSMVNEVESRLGRLDIVVNCAGVMYFTLMRNFHLDEWEETVDVNCKGVLNVCGAALPSMLSNGRGHVVNISSDAARTVFPALTVYNASKAFVNTFSKGLRAECVGTGIRVTDIQPGDTATNLIMKNTDKEAANKLGVRIGEVVGAGAAREYYLDPEDVAAAVLYAVCSPPHVGVHEVLIEPRDQMFGDPTALNDA